MLKTKAYRGTLFSLKFGLRTPSNLPLRSKFTMWLSTRKCLFSFGNFYHHFQHFSLPDGHANPRPKTQLYPLLSATNLSTNPRGTCVLTAEMSGLLILTCSLFYPSPSALSHKLRNTNRDLRFHLEKYFP